MTAPLYGNVKQHILVIYWLLVWCFWMEFCVWTKCDKKQTKFFAENDTMQKRYMKSMLV